MIPWALYNLTPRDQGSPILRPWHLIKFGTGVGATGASENFIIPAETILLLTSVDIAIEAVGAVFAKKCIASAFDPATGINHWSLTEYNPFQTSTKDLSLCKTGSPIVVLEGGDTINCAVQLTAAGNFSYWTSVSGVLIPRGTFAKS